MNIADVFKNGAAPLDRNGRSVRIGASDVIWFSLFILLGSLAILFPFWVLGLVALVAVLGICRPLLVYMRFGSLEVWQLLVLAALTGYIVLNYGFANLVFRVGGVPIIVGHGLMFIGLVLAVLSCRRVIIRAWAEPAMIIIWTLIAFSCVHLIFDLPRYGFYALRDSSMFVEGIFLLLGFLWSTRTGSAVPIMKWLMVVFVLHWIYSLSFFWSAELNAWSPQSGIFLTVPLLGSYWTAGFYLAAGALFALLVGSHLVKWPGWTMLFLAAAQLFGLAIHQHRSMYIGVVLSFIILLFLGERRMCAKLGLILSLALGVILLISVLGIQLAGRVGPVSGSFLFEHAQSLSGAKDTPAVGSIYDRENWYAEVWKRIGSSTTTVLVGEGFGQTLIDFTTPEGVAVRQPHNSHLTVLARLGALGLTLWILFHIFVLKSFIYALRRRAQLDATVSDFILWLFLFYVLNMISSSVQPGFEFSHGAIPFYFLMGLALGIIRWQRLGGTLRDDCRENPFRMRRAVASAVMP